MSHKTINLSKEIIFEGFVLKIHESTFYEVIVNDDYEFNTKDLEELVVAQKKIGEQLLPVLIMCAENATTNTDLLKVLSKNNNNPYSKADAFVISSMVQKILANFYIKVFKPERPTKFFNNKDEASKWLKQFI